MATTKGVSTLQLDYSGVKEYNRTFKVAPACPLFPPPNSFFHFQDLRFTTDVLAQLDHSWEVKILPNRSLEIRLRVKYYPDKAFKLHPSQVLLLAGANRKAAADLDFQLVEVGSSTSDHTWVACTICFDTTINRITKWEDSVDSITVVLKFQSQSTANCSNLKRKRADCNPADVLGLGAGNNLITKDFFLNDFLSDVTLVCDGQRFPAHRFVLSCRSSVFQRMFQTDMKERKERVVKIQDVDSDVLKEVLHFMYKDELSTTEIGTDLWLNLYKFAHKYEIQVLKLKCRNQIRGNISPEKTLQLLIFADKLDTGDDRMQLEALELIKKEKKVMAETTSLLDFTKNYPHVAFELFYTDTSSFRRSQIN